MNAQTSQPSTKPLKETVTAAHARKGPKPVVVTFRDSFSLGGRQITTSITNTRTAPSSLLVESFELDFEAQLVWIRLDLGTRIVTGFSPFSNVLGVGYEPEEPAPKAAAE
jgi:hypothetical protein